MPKKLSSELERLRRYDEELSKVMPSDFKDWHQNSKEEWPEIAAWVIQNLRKQLEKEKTIEDANKIIRDIQ